MITRIVRDAFLTRPFLVPGRLRFQLGAVYEGQAVVEDAVQSGHQPQRKRQIETSIDPGRVASAEKLSGTYVYLEIFRPHFGHVMLETMSRAWYLTNLDPNIRIILHGDLQRSGGEIPSYLWTLLNGLSISPERVCLANRDLVVEELIVPSAQFWTAWKGSPGFCRAFDHVREHLGRTDSNRDFPKKLYLSRRQFRRKLVQNEADAEALFASRGYRVISPEKLPFEEQIRMAGQATHLAGLAGSALHMILFNNKPGTKLIELTCPRRARDVDYPELRYRSNQLILNEVRGVDAYHICCANFSDAGKLARLDISVLRRALDDIAY
jgi:capsular polysaccharide biosynthesis protein